MNNLILTVRSIKFMIQNNNKQFNKKLNFSKILKIQFNRNNKLIICFKIKINI